MNYQCRWLCMKEVVVSCVEMCQACRDVVIIV